VKGVVLAGGLGTRLAPMTRVVNKHLLDVFDEPMVFYPLRSLVDAGITDIVLVTGQEVEQFQGLLGEGEQFGASLRYAVQEGEGGIADALGKAGELVGEDSVVVILGDNIFQDDLRPYIEAFEQSGSGARLLLRRVSDEDARRFGVATVEDGRIVRVVEKPAQPESDLVVTGCYMYDSRVFEIIRSLEPSARGELEITDVNNAYIDAGDCAYDILRGWWTDAGTPASKLKASIMVALSKGLTFQA
jgi:glucose-1-phosphate thymidylyltransferase